MWGVVFDIKLRDPWACLYINKSNGGVFLTDSHNFYENLLHFNNLILTANYLQIFYH